MTSINNSLSSILIKSTVNKIGEAGTASLSDALKSNTALTKLNLCGKDKRSNTNGIHQQTTLSILIKSIVNEIGERGATSLSEALKSNTTLTKLNLRGRHKRNNTQMVSINNQLFSILIKTTGNNIREAVKASLRDALKSNTTLTILF